MTTCTLCKEAVDIVNEYGLCDDCEDYVEALEEETYIEEGEE